MPGEYLPIAVLIFLATGLAFLVVILGHLFGPRRPNPIKAEPYESGIYLIAVLFILFDIEIVFLLPWAVVLREIKMVGLIEMAVFMLVLLVGLIYAWKAGALEWE